MAYQLLSSGTSKNQRPAAHPYRLSRDELIIDGIRQPDELLHRIIDKYFKPDDQFDINYIGGDPGTHTDAYYRSLVEYQKRAEDNIDKLLVADLLQDGLITDPKNVSFTLTDKSLTINGKKQSDETYKKYKEKYSPGNTGSGWSWNYTNHK